MLVSFVPFLLSEGNFFINLDQSFSPELFFSRPEVVLSVRYSSDVELYTNKIFQQLLTHLSTYLRLPSRSSTSAPRPPRSAKCCETLLCSEMTGSGRH